MKLALTIYTATQSFPRQEQYGLMSQMRRAAVSIPCNIAEGKGRLTDRDRAHFFSQARGSLLEWETQILIAEKLAYMPDTSADSLLDLAKEVGQMLNSLIESIRPRSERFVAASKGLA
jgi:four helix bundle protein